MAAFRDEELVRNILLKTFPEAKALNDETLDDILHQRPVPYLSDDNDDENVVHMDFAEILEVLKDAVPIVAGMLTIVKAHYEIKKLKQESIAVSNLPSASDIVHETLRDRPASGSGPAGSLLTKIAQNVIEVTNRAF